MIDYQTYCSIKDMQERKLKPAQPGLLKMIRESLILESGCENFALMNCHNL